LIFHNNTEIRPAGGFIGSYGVLTINDGQMTDLKVEDIYWPDHPINMTRKVIAPKPLQSVTKDWGARDANWFFDFPSSAETVMGFLESSKIFRESNIIFDGAIAINTDVLRSVLRAAGAIPVEEYDLVIDEDNFLAELQREVETGKDKEAGENPKRILSIVAPTLMERLSELTDENKLLLGADVDRHIKKKDIMFYMRDRKIANLMNTLGVDGSVYSLPPSNHQNSKTKARQELQRPPPQDQQNSKQSASKTPPHLPLGFSGERSTSENEAICL